MRPFVSGFIKQNIELIENNEWEELWYEMNEDHYPHEIAQILITLRTAGITVPMDKTTIGKDFDLYDFPYVDNNVLCSKINNIPKVSYRIPDLLCSISFVELAELLESKIHHFTEAGYLLTTQFDGYVDDEVRDVFYCYTSDPREPENINITLYIVGSDIGNVIRIDFDSNDNLFQGVFYPNCGYAFNTKFCDKCARRLLDTVILFVEGQQRGK